MSWEIGLSHLSADFSSRVSPFIANFGTSDLYANSTSFRSLSVLGHYETRDSHSHKTNGD